MDPKAVTWEGAVPAITWQDNTASDDNPDHRYILLTLLPPKFLGLRDNYTSWLYRNLKKNLKKKNPKVQIEKKMQ